MVLFKALNPMSLPPEGEETLKTLLLLPTPLGRGTWSIDLFLLSGKY